MEKQLTAKQRLTLGTASKGYLASVSTLDNETWKHISILIDRGLVRFLNNGHVVITATGRATLKGVK